MITQSMIIELREKTGAGVMNCRNVLHEAQGDMEKAIAMLKEKGLTIAATKAERKTSEGLISAYVTPNHQSGAIIELNCETDFVAVNQEFRTLANALAEQAATSTTPSVAEFMEEKYAIAENMTVKEAITSLISKLRENITIGRLATFVTQTGFIQSYLHNGGRIGVLVELNQAPDGQLYQVAFQKESRLHRRRIIKTQPDIKDQFAPIKDPFEGKLGSLSSIGKEMAMQIAAANPLFTDQNQVDPEILENEKRAYRFNALQEGKPEAIADKIVFGKISKFLKEKCLIEQAWIKTRN